MAAPTNTFTSTSAVGNREDLSNIIDRISPTDTPFYSMCAKNEATATLHEWQTQALAAPGDNAAAEGDDAVATVVTPTVRLSNRTQILTKTVSVSGTQDAVNSAGRAKEMGYQVGLKGLELRNDIEWALTNSSVSATSPRKLRGLIGWMGDNVNAGAGYVAPNYITNVAQTDGATRAFTEAMVKDVAQKVYAAGGNPDVIMMAPITKQTFSGFTANNTRDVDASDKKIYATVDVYVTDFGPLKAIVNRVQRTRDVFVLQSDKWAVSVLRPMQTTDLAKTGDSIRKQLLVELTLEAKNPKANGLIADIA
jgi:hypothetical protein